MPNRAPDPAWLPDHQLHAALTLAHADQLIERLGDVLYEYLKNEPLGLENVFEGELCHVTVTDVAPLPPAVPRYAADALTQLRAAVEHTVYAEVETALGRELTLEEGRRIEMPATTRAESFTSWLRQRKRPELPPLREGSDLVSRMRSLQPYRRKDSDEHPLRVLAEHTNLAKHRTPAVAAVRLGRVNTWPLQDPDVLTATRGAPLEIGAVLATGPKYKQVPVDIWPQVAIRRPHTGDWMVVVKELGQLAEWVRTVAVPVLVTGDAEARPPLPAQIDTAHGWDDLREAIRTGTHVPAHQRHLVRLQAHPGRGNLVETLTMVPDGPKPGVVQEWVDRLTDAEVVAQLEMLGRAAQRGPLETLEACRRAIQLAEDASEHQG